MTYVRTYMTSFSGIQIFGMNMPLFHVVKRDVYISFVASPLMKYAFISSLDEINGIFIPKM